MFSIVKYDSNILGSLSDDNNVLKPQQQSINKQQLLEELKNTPKTKNIIFSIVKHMTQTYIPTNISLLLVGITTSQEIHQIYQSASDYIINVLHLYQYFLEQHVPQSMGFDLVPFKNIIAYEQVIAQTPTDEFASLFNISNKIQGIKTIQQILKHIKTQHSPLNIKLQNDDLQFMIYDQEFRIRKCILLFDNLSQQFTYTHESLQVLIEYGLAADEIMSFYKSISEKYIKSPMTQYHTHKYITKILQITKIDYVNTDDIDIRILSCKCTGKDLYNQTTIVTPMQLACIILTYKDLLKPVRVSGFYLNGQLYYQVQFVYPQGYKPISELADMMDTFQNCLVDHMCDLLKYYQETLRRTIVFSQYNIENILVMPYKDDLSQGIVENKQDVASNQEQQGSRQQEVRGNNIPDNNAPQQGNNNNELDREDSFYEEDKHEYENRIYYRFMFLSIPTSHFPTQMSKQFIFANMKHSYCLQYMVMDISSNILLRNEPLIKYLNHILNMAIKIGEDRTLIKQYKNMLHPKDCVRVIAARTQQALDFLYMCVIKTNIMTEALLSVFTLLKSGFINLKHSTYRKIINYEMNYFEYVNYDRQTTWQTLLGNLQTYYQKPDNDSQVLHIHRDIAVRDYIIQQMPKIDAFMELKTIGVDVYSGQLRPLTLGSPNVVQSLGVYDSQTTGSQVQNSHHQANQKNHNSNVSQSASVINDKSVYLGEIYKPRDVLSITHRVEVTNAKTVLIAAIHELQHLPRPGYMSEIDPSLPFLPQILADSTSITPLCNAIKFSYKDQAGVDAGGMWRATLSQLFDDILGDCQLSNEILEKIKENDKFGKRDLDFQMLNKGNPNPPSLLKVINLESESVLVPHYNGYVCLTSSNVFPRLTDKRSCLYYFGRLVAFCMIFSGKMPKFLHFNFWKSLVGGRLYIDENIKKMYKQQLEEDPMFTINGTRDLNSLFYPLSTVDVRTFYKEYAMMWEAIIAGQADTPEDAGIPDATLNELQTMNIDVSTPELLRQYATSALASMRSGVAFAKAYSEFRNGFRHPFATSMSYGVQTDFRRYAQYIDIALELIDPAELEDLLTFDPAQESYLNRQYIIQNVLHRNINKYKLEHDDPGQVRLVERIMQALTDEARFLHKDIVDMVFAATGQRTLLGTEITLQFKKPSQEEAERITHSGTPVSIAGELPQSMTRGGNRCAEHEENCTGSSEQAACLLNYIREGSGILNPSIQKQFIVFHTCFNQMDIPYLYAAQLSQEQLRDYIKESVRCALDNGFAIM